MTTRTRLKRTTTPKTKTNYGEYRFCNLVPRIRNNDGKRLATLLCPCISNSPGPAAHIPGMERRTGADGHDSHGTGYGRHQLRHPFHAQRYIGESLSGPDAFGYGRLDEYHADRLPATGLHLDLQQRIDCMLRIYGYRHPARRGLPAAETVCQHIPCPMCRIGS